MPASAEFIYSALASLGTSEKAASKLFALSAMQVGRLRASLSQDAEATLGKACLSLADGVGSIDRGAYSWGCVKLYYSCFYSVKAWLFASDECHVYLDNKTPAYIHARPGHALIAGKGKSHEFAFERFTSRFSSLGILSQTVGIDTPFDWLRMQREEVQYHSAGFSDPVPPDRFRAWMEYSPRHLINLYLETPDNATEFAMLFDPAHAMIAIPVRLLADLIRTVRLQRSFQLSTPHLKQFRELCRIDRQPVAPLISLVRG